MKILFICGAGIFSGKEKVTLTLMNALRAQGNEIMCLTAVWGNGQFASLLKEQGFAYKRTRLGFISLTLSFFAIKCTLHQLIYIPKLWFDYKRFVKKHKPEIIVHCNFHHLLLLYPVLNQKQKHYYHSHETISCTKQYKWLFKLFDKKIVKFIGVSNFVASSLINVGLSPGKVTFIHNGLEKVKNVPKTHSTIFTIGIAGQIGRWKGHEDLFEALAILKESNIDFNCLIFGSGNEKYVKFLKEKAIYLKIDKNIAWKGFTLAQEEIYEKIDVLCVPSRSNDPLPTTAIEAGFYAIPVIATNRGGLPEIIRENETGYLINVETPDELAQKLKELEGNTMLCRQLGLNAKLHVETNFSISKMAAAFTALFESN